MSAPACIANIIVPPERDLGGFSVRRALPSAPTRSVGPFVFLDQMGPADFAAGAGIDVRPHPHIGLATLTYLLQGEIAHRDSLGSAQVITPGAVNLMVAGGGIVHSERTPDAFRHSGGVMEGLQFWLALPRAEEEREPSFDHYEAGLLPALREKGLSLRLAIGELHGLRAPMRSLWSCFLADIELAAGAAYVLPAEYAERALFLVSGEVEIDGARFAPGRLIVLKAGVAVTVKALGPARLAAIGGDPLDGPRFLWWNLVSSRRERIIAAREDWIAGKFPGIEGDPEFIPAPELKAL